MFTCVHVCVCVCVFNHNDFSGDRKTAAAAAAAATIPRRIALALTAARQLSQPNQWLAFFGPLANKVETIFDASSSCSAWLLLLSMCT